jgi:thymidylate kinase
MNAKSRRALLITFSGLDGSGKSTQIENLRGYLESCGLRTTVLAFWDDVVVGKRYREDFVHKVYRSEKGIGAPGKPVQRRDKNVRAWYLSLARHVLYAVDAIHLAEVAAKARRAGFDAVIFDRYIYDELANLPLTNRFTRRFVQGVAAFVPQPEIAYLLDADVEAAHARKPEYPVDFMRKCRFDYFRLAELLGNLTVIPALPLQEAKAAVIDALNALRFRRKSLKDSLAYPAA